MRRLPNLRSAIAAAFLLWIASAALSCRPLPPGTPEGPIDIRFTLEKQPGRLSQYRGRNTLLVLMRTSELVSQIYMSRLKTVYAELISRCNVLVMTVEPTEAPFVETYRESEELPFTPAVAEPELVTGDSSLGVIPRVPHTYFIDPEGRVRYHISGVLEPEEIRRLTDRFFRR